MARKNALLAEVFIFISCGLILVSNGQRCLLNPGNTRSLVRRSPVVLEGRVEETRHAASQPTDSGLVDAVISLVTVFKGQVDGGSQERIVVGPFGASESTQICVGESRVIGDELVLFLSASSNESAEVDALRHFRLMVNPVVADAVNRRRVQNYASPSIICGPSKLPCIESGYCLHGGTCYITALEHRYCECAPGFEGKRCQEKISLSEIETHAPPSLRIPHTTKCNESEVSEHCLNGGSCFIIHGQRYCQCSLGFLGTRCGEKVLRLNAKETHAPPSLRIAHATSCNESEHCLNGGSCFVISVDGERFCVCSPGFEGTRCAEKVSMLSPIEKRAPPSLRIPHSTSCNESEVSEHCLNGGSCFLISEHGGQRYCRCPQGFEGKRCEEKVLRLNAKETHDSRRCLTTDARGCVARQRRMISTSWSKIGFQTDSSKGVSLPGVEDSADDRHHSNGGGKLRTNVATSDDSARLLRPQKPQDVLEPGLHRGRDGQNGPLKTGDLPVPV